jgi:hypothetical protein
MSEFTYEIKGITLTGDEIKKIHTKYERFQDAKMIDTKLKLNNPDLAYKVAGYYNDGGWDLAEELSDAIQYYTYDLLEDYLLKNNLATEEELEQEDCSAILYEKTKMDINNEDTLCEELKCIYVLNKKFSEWFDEWR